MLKRFFGSTALVLSLFYTSPIHATMAVVDAKAIAEARKQISELTKQLEELKKTVAVLEESKALAEDSLEAIGEASQIRLPMINLQKLGNQLASDAQCLIPDMEGLFPSVSFEDIELGSLCGRREAYKQTLWVPVDMRNPDGSPAGASGSPDFAARNEQLKIMKKRRHEFGVEASASALATADGAQEAASDHMKSLDGILQSLQSGEKSLNARIDLMVRAQVINGKAMSKNTQVQAELLRLQSAWYIISTGRTGQQALEGE